MAEMVDAHDSGSCDLLVQVQVLFGAPLNKAPVAELVDAHAWGACGATRAGSSPVWCTNSF